MVLRGHFHIYIDGQMNDTSTIAFMVLEGVLSEESSLCIVHACMVFGLHCVLSFHMLLRRYFEKVSDSYSHCVHTVNALEPKSWAARVSSIMYSCHTPSVMTVHIIIGSIHLTA